MTIRFVTSNEGKVREAREYLEGIDEVEQVRYGYTEIQSDDLGEIAAHGALETFDALDDGEGVLVDDAGLFVDALGGFPGPYSAFVEDTVGVERLWRLAEGEENRRAHFRTVIAYVDGDTRRPSARSSEETDPRDAGVETFEGSVAGTLVAPRGEGGFGYDPIFEYNGRTMAEMSTEEKNAISHRGRALAQFAEWYANREE